MSLNLSKDQPNKPQGVLILKALLSIIASIVFIAVVVRGGQQKYHVVYSFYGEQCYGSGAFRSAIHGDVNEAVIRTWQKEANANAKPLCKNEINSFITNFIPIK